MLHYLAIGSLLFAARATLGTQWARLSGTVRPRIVITAAQRDVIRHELMQKPGQPPPTADQERAQVEHAVDEEILYREALARGLDRDDPVVRERVIQNMRLLSDDSHADEPTLFRQGLDIGLDRSDIVVRRHLAASMRLLTVTPARMTPPSDEELLDVFTRESERFRLPGTTSITHVFVSGKRGPAATARAQRILDELRTGHVEPADAPPRGDPFPLGFQMSHRTDRDLDAVFGAGFAAAVAVFSPGSWSGPVPSSYGLHLVWVHERIPQSLPSLDSVRGRLMEQVYHARGEERFHRWLADQRARYEVRVEDPRDVATALQPVAIPAEALALPRPVAIVGD